MAHLFIFGLGYSAKRIKRSLEGLGWTVTATGNDGDIAFEEDAAVREALRDATHVLSSVPPDRAADPVLARYGDALGHRWLGYLSSTGVYGDTGGAVVDETAPLNPTGARQRARAAAEAAWRGSGLPVHVFRLGGIYGPARSAIDQVRAGRAKRIDRPGHVFSRIHVEDAATVLLASMARPDPGAVYNLCDDEPAEPQAVVAEACRLLGVAPPPLVALEEADLSPMARSFWTDNRRVSNARIKRDLGVVLR